MNLETKASLVENIMDPGYYDGKLTQKLPS